MRADHEGFLDLHAHPIAHLEQLPRLRGRQCNGLLAEHVLPRFGRAHRPWHVQMVRQRIVDGVDIGIVQQIVVRAVRLGDAQLVGRRPGLLAVARGDRGDGRELPFLHGRNHLARRDPRDTEHSPSESSHSPLVRSP